MSDDERVTKPFKFVTGKRACRCDSVFVNDAEHSANQRFSQPVCLLLSSSKCFQMSRSAREALFPFSLSFAYLIGSVAGVDARFPNMNQTKHCWQNYVDYHKCVLAKGEDFAPCRQVISLLSPVARPPFAYAAIVLPCVPITLPEQLGKKSLDVLASSRWLR